MDTLAGKFIESKITGLRYFVSEASHTEAEWVYVINPMDAPSFKINEFDLHKSYNILGTE